MSMKVLRLKLLIDAQRKRRITDDYRAAMWFGERNEDGAPVVHDGILLFEDTEEGQPGEELTARVWVLHGDLLPSDVGEGTEFRFLEGVREADHAEVLDVLIDDVERPLGDRAAAKARPLRPA